jgi:hypothetical protein
MNMRALCLSLTMVVAACGSTRQHVGDGGGASGGTGPGTGGAAGSDAGMGGAPSSGTVIGALTLGIGGTPTAVAAAPNARVAIAGTFSGTASFGPSASFASAGGTDVFVTLADEAGQIPWARQGGGSSMDNVLSATVTTNGNIVITGAFDTAATFGQGSTTPVNLTAISPAGVTDVYVAGYDIGGTLLWAKSAGTPATDFETSVAPIFDGGFYFMGLLNADDTTGSGSFFGTPFSSSGKQQLTIARFDDRGIVTWMRTASTSAAGFATGIAAFSDGGAAFAGILGAPAQFFDQDTPPMMFSLPYPVTCFAASTDSNGNFGWIQPSGAPGVTCNTVKLAILSDNQIVTIGFYGGEVRFAHTSSTDFTILTGGTEYAAWYRRDGFFERAIDISGNVMAVNALSAGAIVVSGTFTGVLTIGTLSAPSAGGTYLLAAARSRAREIRATGGDSGRGLLLRAEIRG